MEHALNYPADMDDALHPNQAGYEKMANVWLEALYNILPLPTRLLTVQKSDEAQGQVTSIPEAIDCGISCTASFIYGAVVNLTATAEYGSVLSHWTGCDSVDGNICTVTLDSNRIVTANFNIVYKDLTIQKAGTGQGTVTNFPSAIDCGSICSVSLPQGAVVNLTATADYGSTFFNWTDCDSVNGNTCTITLGSNRTVTASFSLVTEVKLLSPKGGEIIPAGSEYPISWEAPPGAVTFKFITTCSGQRVSVNTFTGNDAMWGIPLFRENKTGCLSRIKAYNAYGTKIGSDMSDGTFMIAGVRITFPNQGTICTGGQTCTVTWTKSEYVPAASSELSYSLNAGWTWTKIPDLLPGDAESFDWMALDVSKPKTNCKVKVVLRDSDGKIVGRDKSDGTFTIQP